MSQKSVGLSNEGMIQTVRLIPLGILIFILGMWTGAFVERRANRPQTRTCPELLADFGTTQAQLNVCEERKDRYYRSMTECRNIAASMGRDGGVESLLTDYAFCQDNLDRCHRLASQQLREMSRTAPTPNRDH